MVDRVFRAPDDGDEDNNHDTPDDVRLIPIPLDHSSAVKENLQTPTMSNEDLHIALPSGIKVPCVLPLLYLANFTSITLFHPI